MIDTLLGLIVLANEEFVPPTDWRAQIALPAGILIFFGSIFLLLRSNLGSRRAYLVEASAFFGFMLILSLFWGAGAPGTPQNTGPQNLPGQEPDHYLPKWVPFAADSAVVQDPEFAAVADFPNAFGPVPDGFGQAAAGVDEIKSFFAAPAAGTPVRGEWVVDGEPLYVESTQGRPILGVTFVAVDDDGEPVPDDGSYTAFGFFDAGFESFPSLVMIGLSLAGFILHAALLVWDENRERREQDADRVEEPERVPASV